MTDPTRMDDGDDLIGKTIRLTVSDGAYDIWAGHVAVVLRSLQDEGFDNWFLIEFDTGMRIGMDRAFFVRATRE